MSQKKNTPCASGDKKIGVIGGDTRQLVAAGELAKMGYETAVYGFNTYESDLGGVTRCVNLDGAIHGAAAVVLPMPYSTDGIRLNCPYIGDGEILVSDIFSRMYTGQLVLGGRLDKSAFDAAAAAGVKIYDYYEREELAVLNAIPTAEGAVAIAMNELPITLHGANTVVLGYGRVGKTLARTLCALGAHVTVAARKQSDLAWAKNNFCNAVFIRELYKISQTSDVIFNTIPEIVLTAPILGELDKHTLIIDLASKPGGVDVRAAKELGLNVIWALSLPGKVAPVTAGKIITESIVGILCCEEGI